MSSRVWPNRAWWEEEADLIDQQGVCGRCNCPVTRGSSWQHVQGQRHESIARQEGAKEEWEEQHAHQWKLEDRIADEMAAQAYCDLCDARVSGTRFNALQHINGAKHQKALQRQRAKSQRAAAAAAAAAAASAPRPPPPYQPPAPAAASARPPPQQPQEQPAAAAASAPLSDEVLEIQRSGMCKTCNVRVRGSATEHTEGAKHQLQVRWKNHGGIDDLLKDQDGLSVRLQWGDRVLEPSDRAPLCLEVGQQVLVSFILTNRSKQPARVKSVMSIPVKTLQDVGLHMPQDISGLVVRPGYCLPIKRTLEATLARVGVHKCLLAFQMRQALLFRAFDIHIVPKGAAEDAVKLAPIAPYQPKEKSLLADVTDPAIIERGERPPGFLNAKIAYKVPLAFFDLPKNLAARLSNPSSKAALIAELSRPLTPALYAARFGLLLHLEELQMRVDIQIYDRKTTSLTTDARYPGLLRLHVLGLAENRPSVQKGDDILAAAQPFTAADLNNNNHAARRRAGAYSGSVHVVEQEYVYLKFGPEFRRQFVQGQTWHLRFTFNRIPLRRCHQGVTMLQKHAVHRAFATKDGAGAGAGAAAAGASSITAPAAGRVMVTETVDEDECDEWVDREVLSQGLTCVGLDTESVWGAELALIQLATPTAVLLFRVRLLRSLPPKLKHLLELPSVAKYTVGPEARDLQRVFEGLEPEGFVDVQQIVVKKEGLKLLPGLETMVRSYLPVYKAFVKDKELQLSDWSRWPLLEEQVRYAALDAMLARELGLCLHAKPLAAASSLSSSQPSVMSQAFSLLSAPLLFLSKRSTNSSASSSSSSSSAPVPLSKTSRNLNEQQRACVQGIVHGSYHPNPFVVFGPPGTGKTTVLIEAIQQLLLQPSPASAPIRILAVAPSNAAADLLVMRLRNLNTQMMFRLQAVSRPVKSVPEEVLKYSSPSDDNGHFDLPTAEMLRTFRVVVSTCMSGACASGVGMKPGDFSHVFIDEAGHATEPEIMATLGGLLDPYTAASASAPSSSLPPVPKPTTRVILGGDPMQLGPIIRSALANAHGLGRSWLERLITEADTSHSSPYARVSSWHTSADGQPVLQSIYPPSLMVKLLHNYRSHPAILAVPNSLFYRGELIAEADRLERRSLCKWVGWPNGNTDFPVLVHHVEGKEQREADSPSWFNVDEASLIVDYITQLMSVKSFGLQAKDIGVIAPYSKQVQKLRQLATSKKIPCGPNELKIGSVENFQGDERRVILISTVRSQLINFQTFDVKFDLGFVKQPKRLNVALTRAKAALIIVGNAKVLETDEKWKAVLQHCVKNKAIVGDYPSKGAGGDGSSSSSSQGNGSPDDSELQGVLALVQSHQAQQADADAEESDEDDRAGAVAPTEIPFSGDAQR